MCSSRFNFKSFNKGRNIYTNNTYNCFNVAQKTRQQTALYKIDDLNFKIRLLQLFPENHDIIWPAQVQDSRVESTF